MFRAILLTALAASLAMQTCSFAWEGKIVDAPYADELLVQRGEVVERITLYGLSAPRGAQPYAEEARSYVVERAVGKKVRVHPVLTYPRRPAQVRVYVENACLNEDLVKHGLAWWRRGSAPFKRNLARLENQARIEKTGLWAQDDPIPPWSYVQPNRRFTAKSFYSVNGAREGLARERVAKQAGPAKNIFGKRGSARLRLLRLRHSKHVDRPGAVH